MKFGKQKALAIIFLVVLVTTPFAILVTYASPTNAVENPGFEYTTDWTAFYSTIQGSYAKVRDSAQHHTGSYSGLTRTNYPKQEFCSASLRQNLNVPVKNISTFYYWIRKGTSAANGYYHAQARIYLTGNLRLSYYHSFDYTNPPADEPYHKYIEINGRITRTNIWTQISRNLLTDLVNKFSTSILDHNVSAIELISRGTKNLVSGERYGQIVNWDDIYMESEPADMSIILTSSNLDGPPDHGQIQFDGDYYILPNTIEKHPGTYEAWARPEHGNYFICWETSGAASVSDMYSRNTDVTVWGSCTLKAVFSPYPNLWTFMVYIASASDNEFKGMDWLGPFQINQMEKIGSTDLVKVLALCDRHDKPPTEHYTEYLYEIEYDTDYPDIITSDWIYEWDEVNMGDPETLVEFANKCIAEHPALNYALILMNHGAGFRRICNDIDMGVDDYLNMSELQTALDQIEVDNGVDLNLVGAEACLMGQMEVAYQIRDNAEVFVASEELMCYSASEENPWGGLPFEWILGNLTANPLMDAEDLGDQIILSYEEHCQKYPVSAGETNRTLSSIDLSKITGVAGNISVLAGWLYDNVDTYRSQIEEARENVITYATKYDVPWNPIDYVDAYNLSQCLAQEIDNSTLDALCQALMDSIEDAVFAEYHVQGADGSHGLSLYFPDEEADYDENYDSLDMSDDYQWDEFLKEYLGIS